MEAKIKVQKTAKIKDFDGVEVEEITGALLLRSTFKGRIPGNTRAIIGTGVAIEIPEGYLGLITNYDHLIENYPLQAISKTIDSAYREEIEIRLMNFSSYPETIARNQIVAKLILIPKIDVSVKNVAKLAQYKKEE